MKCLNNKTIFNYINKELNDDKLRSISNHLENCEKCNNKYITLQEKIKFVNKELSLLTPKVIPQKTFVKPAIKFKYEKNKVKIKINSIIFAIRELGYKKVIAFSVLSICLILVVLLKNKSQPDYRELSKHIAAIEQSFMENPKQTLNENSFYISYFDKDKMQIEIIRTSIKKKTTSRNIIKLK